MMVELYNKLDSLIADGEMDEAESLVYAAADALAADAAIMHSSGDYYGAVEMFRRIVELMRRYYVENCDFAKIKLSISEIYSFLGDVPAAKKELSEATAILTKELGEDHQLVKDSLEKLQALRDYSQ